MRLTGAAPGVVDVMHVYPNGALWLSRDGGPLRTPVVPRSLNVPALYHRLRHLAPILGGAIVVTVRHGYPPKVYDEDGDRLDTDTAHAVLHALTLLIFESGRN